MTAVVWLLDSFPRLLLTWGWNSATNTIQYRSKGKVKHLQAGYLEVRLVGKKKTTSQKGKCQLHEHRIELFRPCPENVFFFSSGSGVVRSLAVQLGHDYEHSAQVAPGFCFNYVELQAHHWTPSRIATSRPLSLLLSGLQKAVDLRSETKPTDAGQATWNCKQITWVTMEGTSWKPLLEWFFRSVFGNAESCNW